MTVIEVDGLRKTYGEVTAVHDVSFTVREGEVFGILGPNGAGKTTTVECLSGLRVPDAGTVSVLGLDPSRERDALRQVLGVQLQECGLPDRLTVGEILDLFASFHRRPADTGELLDRLGLRDKAAARYRKLSGGQKQRLAIALAMVGRPRAVVLDELTTDLDPHARRATWDLVEQVRDSGVTVVLVTHFMEEAERLCDRVALIDAGRVVAVDTPAGLAARGDRGQRMRFRLPDDFDDAVLRALPEVTGLTRHGGRIEVTGDANLVLAVTSLLARRRVIAADLRVEQATLDDAFLALTGSGAATSPTTRPAQARTSR
ncbi:putative ABC transporter ATP-binding protein [Actinacidiphila reveromycinica]|uniref:ABC-type xenobiotic transporter n=1 Tax=Actinacidiphila reveromycinica TaxID=659352 RepID=A0A7U3VLA0_9ACTN|nr:ABC transporter ATP-binding protein [Streptomyces sp. SN-593]BBA95314.1 putative ABC transporter ATP-binding protein [Streptomyces sp. SN-593]